MSETSELPPPPGAHAAPPVIPEGQTSERIFRDRLIKSLRSFNLKDLRAMGREDLLEPHMHLFVLLVAAFVIGFVTFVVEGLFRPA